MKDRYEEVYRDRRIAIEVDESRPGGWGWRYAIDGASWVASKGAVCRSAAEAVHLGLDAARGRVDALLLRPRPSAKSRPRQKGF